MGVCQTSLTLAMGIDKVRKYKEAKNGGTTGEQGDVEGVQSQETCEEKEEDGRR